MSVPTALNAGEQLDAIMRDLDVTTEAWAAAGYGYGTPEDHAREAVFARLKAWNVERVGAATVSRGVCPDCCAEDHCRSCDCCCEPGTP
jgi:hypothetical protein